MSSLIERAAQRLEQLRSTGVDLQFDAVPPAPGRGRPPAQTRQSRRVELDFAALSRAGFVTPVSPRTRTADEFRILKRPLIANAAKRASPGAPHPNLVMVSSALPGEGKTFTAVNLAISIAAELDHTVLLVDADVRRPSLLRALGLPDAPGLMEVLNGSVQLPDVLLKTNVDRLTLLPSGTPHEGATETLASESMRQLLEDLATRYPDRIIIFDSPPLLLTTESRVLASRMGQILFVVRADETPRFDVENALAALEGCAVYLVLNQATAGILPGSSRGYGYGYGYGYGNGYGNDKRLA